MTEVGTYLLASSLLPSYINRTTLFSCQGFGITVDLSTCWDLASMQIFTLYSVSKPSQ